LKQVQNPVTGTGQQVTSSEQLVKDAEQPVASVLNNIEYHKQNNVQME
jgi:hypothetical protein